MDVFDAFLIQAAAKLMNEALAFVRNVLYRTANVGAWVKYQMSSLTGYRDAMNAKK